MRTSKKKKLPLVMSSILRLLVELLRELDVQTPMLPSTISKLKSTSQFQREMFTRRKKSFKMLPFMISIWLTPSLKVDTISFL